MRTPYKIINSLYRFNISYYGTSVVTKDITDEKVRNDLIRYKDNIDLVIGGFPCQGYSMAGKRDPNDPRNQLYKFTIDVIDKTKPNIFVLENVKGILSFKESDGVLVIKKIEEKLNSIGYYCKYILLDSSKFGVPQKRERVIFLGSSFENKNKIDNIVKKLNDVNETIVTVYDAIYDLEDKEELFIDNHIFTKHTPEMIEKIKHTKPGDSVTKKFSDAFKRIHYDRPSPTVKENHGGVHIHPTKNRVLTPRELARLQSFPDDFKFIGTKSSILKQIGNAVPPKLSEKIAEIVWEEFYGK